MVCSWCMFKLYLCCSLYSVLIFYACFLGEMVQKQFAFLRKSSVNSTRAALLFWKQSLSWVCTVMDAPGLGALWPVLAWLKGSVPVLLGEPGMGWAVAELNLLCSHCKGNPWPSVQNNLLQLHPPFLPSAQGFYPAEVVLEHSCWFVCCRILFLKTRKAPNWACSGVMVLHNKPFHHFPKCQLCKAWQVTTQNVLSLVI